MARHTRRLPRNRQERARANERATQLLQQLRQQAHELHELEATAQQARARLQRQFLRHIDARDLDITEMAQATGISRQAIHRLVRARNPHPPEKVSAPDPHPPEKVSAPDPQPTPDWAAGGRLAHSYYGAGTIEAVDGPNLRIRFDSGELADLHARLATIEPL